MSPYLSEKIRNLSFFSMTLVVLLHGQLISISTGYTLWIQNFVTGELTRIAVPIFFVISGYLFFQNYSRPGNRFFGKKIKKRITTILIPYLFWSFWGLFSLYLMQQILPNSSFFSKKLIEEYNLCEILYAIFINPVGSYQLWFLRDLFVIVLFSPIIYCGIRFAKECLIFLLFVFYILGIQSFIRIDSIFFFAFGAYIALEHKKILEKKYSKRFVSILQFSLWIILCILLVEHDFGYFLHCIGVLWGIWSLWCLYDVLYFYIENIKKINKFAKYSFFIYVTHEPLLTVIKKLLLRLGNSPILILFIYFIAPIVTIFICITIGRILNSYFPKFYAFISGGR